VDADVALFIKRHGSLSSEGCERRLMFEALFPCEHTMSASTLSMMPACVEFLG
jgi:hypothetical protein